MKAYQLMHDPRTPVWLVDIKTLTKGSLNQFRGRAAPKTGILFFMFKLHKQNQQEALLIHNFFV